MVVCDDQTDNDYSTQSATIIVEALTKSTRRIDETIKRFAYQSIPTLQEFIIIEQDFVDFEVCRRSKHYFLGDEFLLESIDITINGEVHYQRVNNEGVKAYLQAKKLSENEGEVS